MLQNFHNPRSPYFICLIWIWFAGEENYWKYVIQVLPQFTCRYLWIICIVAWTSEQNSHLIVRFISNDSFCQRLFYLGYKIWTHFYCAHSIMHSVNEISVYLTVGSCDQGLSFIQNMPVDVNGHYYRVDNTSLLLLVFGNTIIYHRYNFLIFL